MTIPIFPSKAMLPGIMWDATHAVEWSTTVQTARSGKETRVGNWTYPIYHWELEYEYLQATEDAPELQVLKAFFNSAGGQLGTWLYEDDDDHQVTDQPLGLGDGATTTYQLVRASGGYVEPIWAPNAVSSVTVGGVAIPAAHWSVARFGTDTPGLLTLDQAPAEGALITASFSFWFPCRFEEDRLDFKRLLSALYRGEKVPFRSVK